MDLGGLKILGNAVPNLAIALAIVIAGLAGTKFFHTLLQSRIRDTSIEIFAFIQPYRLSRIFALFSYLLPALALFVAREFLFLNEILDTWITVILIVVVQVLVLLILIQIIGSLLESRSMPPEDRSTAENRLLANIEKLGLSKQLKNLALIIRGLLWILPGITILNSSGILSGTWMLPITLFSIGGMLIYRLLKESRHASDETSAIEQKDPIPVEIGDPLDPEDKDATERRAIIYFFLKIFKHQSEAPPSSASKFRRIVPEQPVSHHIYELFVEVGGTWKSRRMTISRLGNETGSRSKCYYVIYDDHLVVKIPPAGIVDIEQYIESLKKEARIAERLDIGECIVPSISVILKHIDPSFKKPFYLFSKAGERFLKSLSESPELQKYLMIGNSFAFFMDLSEYYFLQHVINEIHDRRNKMEAEIIAHADISWDYLRFESQYGDELVPIVGRLEKMHGTFEKEIVSRAHPQNSCSDLSGYQIKKYFFTRLAGSRDTDFENALMPNILESLQTSIETIFQKHQPVIDAYRKIIDNAVTENIFARNKTAMAGIITNLLVLLEHLQRRGVSMRDLKPDNLLVAGDRTRYPNFLVNPDDYKIGVIDVETAIIYGGSSVNDLPQPQLGGTPMYATPSHFFPNQMLHSLLGDLATSFHLQDWHAIICIIYKVITGQFLFTKTGRTIPNILKVLFKKYNDPDLLKASAKNVSLAFWRNASIEFHQKMSASKKKLGEIFITIPEPAMRMMKDFLLKEKQKTVSKMEASINAQPLFSNKATRESFRILPPEKIKNYAHKLKSRKGINPVWNQNKNEILTFFNDQIRIKMQMKEQTRLLNLLERSSTTLPVHQLLEIMFEVVLRHMYREDWQETAVDDSDLTFACEDDALLRSTIKEAREWQALP